MANQKTITLPEPHTTKGGAQIEEVTLTEPSVPALQGLEINGVIRGDTTQLLILLPRISELTEADVKKLSFKNLAALSMSVTNFLGS